MVRICGEKDRGRSNNDNVDDASEWTLNDRNTKT